MSAQNTVILAGHARGRYDEARATGAIIPGHLIKLNSDGTVGVHATAGGTASRIVAIEDALIGKGINDAYATGDLVRHYFPDFGEEMNMLIPAAAAAIVVGDRLTSNGDGTLKKANGTTDKELFVALEAKDNSAGATAYRLKVRPIN